MKCAVSLAATVLMAGTVSAKVVCGGIVKEFVYDAPDKVPIVFGGWSRAEGVEAQEYCVYADVKYTDGSALWAQMAADMFGVPVRVHRTPREATSLGAALTAGVGIGWYRDFEEASACIHIQREVTPQAANTAVYRRHYELYRTLYPNMKEAYEAIYCYQTEA